MELVNKYFYRADNENGIIMSCGVVLLNKRCKVADHIQSLCASGCKASFVRISPKADPNYLLTSIVTAYRNEDGYCNIKGRRDEHDGYVFPLTFGVEVNKVGFSSQHNPVVNFTLHMNGRSVKFAEYMEWDTHINEPTYLHWCNRHIVKNSDAFQNFFNITFDTFLLEVIYDKVKDIVWKNFKEDDWYEDIKC